MHGGVLGAGAEHGGDALGGHVSVRDAGANGAEGGEHAEVGHAGGLAQAFQVLLVLRPADLRGDVVLDGQEVGGLLAQEAGQVRAEPVEGDFFEGHLLEAGGELDASGRVAGPVGHDLAAGEQVAAGVGDPDAGEDDGLPRGEQDEVAVRAGDDDAGVGVVEQVELVGALGRDEGVRADAAQGGEEAFTA